MQAIINVLLGIAVILGLLDLIFMAIRRAFRLSRGLRPLRVYVAGPYSVNPTEGVAAAIQAADELLTAGYKPFVPHLTHLWHERYPQAYEVWMQYDFAYLAVCDALVRLPGYSPGADREVALAKQRGVPVYEGVQAFLERYGACRG